MNAVSVWKRTGIGTMSAQRYAVWIAFWTASGIAVSAVSAYFAASLAVSPFWMLTAFPVALLGGWIARKSGDLIVSLVGYLLITIPFGLITGPLLALYTGVSVVRILFLTTLMVIGFGVLGAIAPKSLEGWRSWLIGGLLVLIAGSVLLPAVSMIGAPIESAMAILDWVGVILFSGFVVFDLNRAMRIPYTMNNAIDSAIEIYLDFANLFILLLSRSDDSDRD